MKQCGRCGTQNLDHQTACSGCGQPLPAAPAGLGGTMVMQPPEPPAAPAPAAPAPANAPKGNLRGTMIGMAPPNLAELGSAAPLQPPPPASASQPPPGAGAGASNSQPPGRQFGATMLGMAPPNYPSPPPPPDPRPAAPASVVGSQRLASAQKTVIGVARPGIAPMNPGQQKAAPAAAPAAVSPPPGLGHTAPLGHAQPGAAAPGAWPPAQPPNPAWNAEAPPPAQPGPRRVSLTATLAIVGSSMLLVLAVVAYFMLRGHGSVTARANLDGSGNELLELSCSECPDGTKTWIDSAPVAFQAGKATLHLQAPLKVGENPIVLVLERPGRSREEIALALPIEFRVRSSTEELSQDSPKISVLASVLAGTKLEVDGKPVTGDGVVRFDYDVTADTSGAEASVKTLERVVPYKAVSATGVASDGKVEIRLGITPLIVDAPGTSIIVGGKDVVIAGRTAPGAVLKVGAQAVSLDPEGRFVSKQALTLGENAFTVRSTLKDHAPRLIQVSVRRSDNLEREASLAKAMAQTSYVDVIRDGDAAIGRNVALDGQLFDLRHDGYSSVLLLDVKDGCKKGPCLAKVVYGVEAELDKGRGVKAFGKVLRFVDGPRSGQRIPEVRADLVVPGGS